MMASTPRPPVISETCAPTSVALVVDAVIGAGLARDRGLLLRRDGGDHGRAARLRELDGVLADRSRAARDKERHARTGLGEFDGVTGGERRNAETRHLLRNSHSGRKRHRLCRRHDDEFGRGAGRPPPLPVPEPDPFAHARCRNASPTASISPAPSLCGITRGNAILRRPRLFTSEGLTPDVASRTRTSPAPGFGVTISPVRNTSRAGPIAS